MTLSEEVNNSHEDANEKHDILSNRNTKRWTETLPSHTSPPPNNFSGQTQLPVNDSSERNRIIQDYGQLAASFGFTVKDTAPQAEDPNSPPSSSPEIIPIVLDNTKVYTPPKRSTALPVARSFHVSALAKPVAEEFEKRRGRYTSGPLTASPPTWEFEESSRHQEPPPVPREGMNHSSESTRHIRALIKQYARQQGEFLRRMEIMTDEVDGGHLTGDDLEQALADWVMMERVEGEFNGEKGCGIGKARSGPFGRSIDMICCCCWMKAPMSMPG